MAKSYPLKQAEGMHRYGSLININPSGLFLLKNPKLFSLLNQAVNIGTLCSLEKAPNCFKTQQGVLL